MYPLLLGVPFYFLSWVLAAAVGITLGCNLATRQGMPLLRSALALCCIALAILVGAKTLYLVESHWFPHDDYVPSTMRGLYHGFRMPGGILLMCLTLPVIASVLRLPWRRFGDAIILVLPLALIFIRFGCFLNGCCFGSVSTQPWALQFPSGSWAYWFHHTHQWVAPSMAWSLPVHPLQLYLATAAILLLAFLFCVRRRTSYPGQLQLVFYVGFFGSTALVEPFRQNLLTLDSSISAIATVVFSGILVMSVRSSCPSCSG